MDKRTGSPTERSSDIRGPDFIKFLPGRAGRSAKKTLGLPSDLAGASREIARQLLAGR